MIEESIYDDRKIPAALFDWQGKRFIQTVVVVGCCIVSSCYVVRFVAREQRLYFSHELPNENLTPVAF